MSTHLTTTRLWSPTDLLQHIQNWNCCAFRFFFFYIVAFLSVYSPLLCGNKAILPEKLPPATTVFFSLTIQMLVVCENPCRSVSLNHVPGGPLALHIYLNQTCLIQIISSETDRPVMSVTDKGDIQNLQCWWCSRIVVKKYWAGE